MLQGSTITGISGNTTQSFAAGNVSGITLTAGTYNDVRADITNCTFNTTAGDIILEYDTAGTYQLTGTKTGTNSLALQVTTASVVIVTDLPADDYLNGLSEGVAGATATATIEFAVVVTDGTGDAVGGRFSIFNDGVELTTAVLTTASQEFSYQGDASHWVWSRPGFQALGGAIGSAVTINPIAETGGASTTSNFAATIAYANNIATITVSAGGSGPSDITNGTNTYGMLENLKGTAAFNNAIGRGLFQGKTIFAIFRKEGPADQGLDSTIFTFRSSPSTTQRYIGGILDTTGTEGGGISTAAIPGQTISQVLNSANPTASLSNVQEALKLILNDEDEEENLLYSIGRRLKTAIDSSSRLIPTSADDKLG